MPYQRRYGKDVDGYLRYGLKCVDFLRITACGKVCSHLQDVFKQLGIEQAAFDIVKDRFCIALCGVMV